MRKLNKIFIGFFIFAMFFTLFNVNNVLAVEEPSISVNGDIVQTQIQANNKIMFTFRGRTRLRFNPTVNIDLNINCDALRIGVKDFEIEIDADQNLQMNMTCTEEQAELGLLKGNTYQIRKRYRYQEGFCLLIQCNSSDQIQAKFKLQATNENRFSSWAYYDETSEEWVTVPTTVEDGYLVAETDHFSYWSVLTPETENNFMIYIGIISVIGIIAILSVIYLRKRK